MNSPAGAPRLNTLLAALPDLEWQRVRCNLKQEFQRGGAMQHLLLRYTQALITQMAQTAGDLQHSGLIRYRRGHITVVDRAGLEARCCECYAVVRRETDRLLPIPDRFADIAALKAGMSPRPYRLVKSHEHAYIAT